MHRICHTMSYNLVSLSFESESMTVHAPFDSPEHVGCGYLSSANLMGSTMNFGGWRFQHPKRGTTALLVPSNGHSICQRNLKKRCYWTAMGRMRTKADVHANLNFCFLDFELFNRQKKHDFWLGTWTTRCAVGCFTPGCIFSLSLTKRSESRSKHADHCYMILRVELRLPWPLVDAMCSLRWQDDVWTWTPKVPMQRLQGWSHLWAWPAEGFV